MKLHEITIGIIIISLMTMGVTLYISDLGSRYGTEADFSGLNLTNRSLTHQSEISENLTAKITGFQLSHTIGDVVYVPYQMIKIAWEGMKVVFNSFTTVHAIITDIGRTAGDVGFSSSMISNIIAAVTAIFSITLVFIVIYAFLKWKAED